MPEERPQPGYIFRIRKRGAEDNWAYGQVALASENGKSVLILILEGCIRWNGGMFLQGGYFPLSIDYEDETVKSPFTGDQEYDIDVLGEKAV